MTKAIVIRNATIGTVSSREDGSVAFRVITGELLASQKGAVMDYHGKACEVTVTPLEGALETIEVKTEPGHKSPSQRMYAVLHVWWKQQGGEGVFQHFYEAQMEKLIQAVKNKLDPV